MAAAFGRLSGKSSPEWFASCDPAGSKLGSGGGIAQVLADAWQSSGGGAPFNEWLGDSKKLVLLAGGQSRRLPAYAATGKILMPVPVMRWSAGQRLDQTLLDLQAEDYRRILAMAPQSARVLVASGDVFLRFPDVLPAIPEADIVGFGMLVSPEVAAGFGVFFSPRQSPGEISFFLQKPKPETIRELGRDHAYFVDTGLWILSARAAALLMRKCGWSGDRFSGGSASPYELYAGLGPSLGNSPAEPDPEVAGLSIAIVPLPDAGFYHFGTTRQMIESLSSLQNRSPGSGDQSHFWRKPHPDMYVLNSDFEFNERSSANRLLWIENSALPDRFAPTRENAITGLPPACWDFSPEPGDCIDCVPIGESGFAFRNYGFDDPFSGPIRDAVWQGRPAVKWFEARGIALSDAGILPDADIQESPLFAVVSGADSAWAGWLLASTPVESPEFRTRWLASPRLNARELTEQVNLDRLLAQRHSLASKAAVRLWAHRANNPFFRIDLDNAAALYAASGEPVPEARHESPDPLDRMHEAAFVAAVQRARGIDGTASEREATTSLSDRIVAMAASIAPHSTLIDDQILWARSPVRLDLAGGWSDTPPFCLKFGGAVVNLGVDLNGQAPVQVFVRMCREPRLVIRSIDLGAECVVRSFDELADCSTIGAEFSLAKAAFCLAGFHPRFHTQSPATLAEALEEFGGGIELSMLAATPKGSGLGTSSVLSATILAALGSAGGLGWDLEEVFRRTLALEQMLTSGGGWQDQAGGIYHGVKLIETPPGLDQKPSIRWLPEQLFSSLTANRTALLYYTGITRVAKTILQEIVRGMLLNNHSHLDRLFEIRTHALAAYQTIQRESWPGLCEVVQRSWELNQALDSGTNTPEVASIIAAVSDWTAGVKLLGAGGGGYMLLLAKDEPAAARIRHHLTANPPNPRARFVDFALSATGLQITRS